MCRDQEQLFNSSAPVTCCPASCSSPCSTLPHAAWSVDCTHLSQEMFPGGSVDPAAGRSSSPARRPVTAAARSQHSDALAAAHAEPEPEYHVRSPQSHRDNGGPLRARWPTCAVRRQLDGLFVSLRSELNCIWTLWCLNEDSKGNINYTLKRGFLKAQMQLNGFQMSN